MSDKALSVTLKGPNAQDPWIVAYGDTPDEVGALVNEIDDSGLLETVANVGKKYRTLLGAQATLDGTFAERQQGGGQQQSGSQASGGAQTEADRWGKEYTRGRPDAPDSGHGPAVHKKWKNQQGKISERWIDPRAKEIPWNFKNGVRSDPDDLWEGDWVSKR